MGMFLKCDAEDCDHREECEGYRPEMIGKPCPECGENLLTQEDFDAFEPMRKAMELMIELGLAVEDPNELESPAELSITHHAGKTSINIEEPTQ